MDLTKANESPFLSKDSSSLKSTNFCNLNLTDGNSYLMAIHAVYPYCLYS